MKSRTSRSLAPRASCSRMVLRRSTASSALESASVWFWHTRQRSSEARSITRFSRSGFCPWAMAEKASAAKQETRSLFTLELPDQRHHALRQHIWRDRADLLEADDALLVDDVGLGHSVNAVVDADFAVRIVERRAVRIAVAREPAQAVLALVLVVQAVERY